ncbi:uncharacterized protein AMSG_04466 [Thecamonas trahens ATCC 50062]|uniref:Uncharacterized protein n=1 Tax=Thecamonas trahens ATCC 50062 TaxID=461836 RepID=A0A0L0D7Q4_THETB|nr:hypothetical protein AMSG_04466 [Thecamonas trahens ATCC 50062]KNC48235.1 hypothetical protein AMSG_04466 [Thecamonas trahens ATCC 50062]|eukprot:XP_013758804.1 hypothetical protein AMSG_04466 [Thecamonas trahens ATCC 50062]
MALFESGSMLPGAFDAWSSQEAELQALLACSSPALRDEPLRPGSPLWLGGGGSAAGPLSDGQAGGSSPTPPPAQVPTFSSLLYTSPTLVRTSSVKAAPLLRSLSDGSENYDLFRTGGPADAAPFSTLPLPPLPLTPFEAGAGPIQCEPQPLRTLSSSSFCLVDSLELADLSEPPQPPQFSLDFEPPLVPLPSPPPQPCKDVDEASSSENSLKRRAASPALLDVSAAGAHAPKRPRRQRRKRDAAAAALPPAPAPRDYNKELQMPCLPWAVAKVDLYGCAPAALPAPCMLTLLHAIDTPATGAWIRLSTWPQNFEAYAGRMIIIRRNATALLLGSCGRALRPTHQWKAPSSWKTLAVTGPDLYVQYRVRADNSFAYRCYALPHPTAAGPDVSITVMHVLPRKSS